MFHGLSNDFLYSAFKIDTTYKNSIDGKEITGSGTAFFVRVAENPYLVTNRHNLDLEYKDPKYKGFSLQSISLIGRFSGDELIRCLLPLDKNQIFYANDRNNDVACIPNPQLLLPPNKRVILDYSILEDMVATEADFQNKFSVCDFLAFPGYPEWHDKIENRPIFRGGTISSDPRRSYHYKTINGECVAYEAFSYGGSSGSPVFALQKGLKPGAGIQFDGFREGMLIGINGGHLPSSESGHSGISYFYKSSIILEIINQISLSSTKTGTE